MFRCTECGFAYDLTTADTAGTQIRSGADALAALLEESRPRLRRRPAPEVWSPLEYGCHVRDVLLVQRERVFAARMIDRPSFHPMGRDERVDYDGYAGQDPLTVARQLRDAAALLSSAFGRLDDGTWDRTVEYRYPEPKERSLRWVAVHTVHEVRHHLGDVQAQLAD